MTPMATIRLMVQILETEPTLDIPSPIYYDPRGLACRFRKTFIGCAHTGGSLGESQAPEKVIDRIEI